MKQSKRATKMLTVMAAFICAIFLIVPVVEQSAYATSVVVSGSCGAHITWVLTDDGKLTLSGSGATYSYTSDAGPFNDYIDQVKSVEVQDGITGLGAMIFYSCQWLERCQLPSSLQTIGPSAFEQCTSLLSVDLSGCSSLTTIGKKAFNNCTSLNGRISIPVNVTSIGNGAFDNCYYVEGFDVAPENASYSSLEGVLFDKSQKTLIRCAEGFEGTLGLYTMPNTVTIIDQGAFYNCALLSDITLSTSLERVRDGAFDTCTALEELRFPEGVSSIGNAFGYCYSLRTIAFPSTLEYLETGIFGTCYALEEIDVADANTHYADVDGVLFSADMTTLYCYPMAKACTSYQIPSTVSVIGMGAFCGHSELEEIDIPSSVKRIKMEAFLYCSGLSKLELPSGITDIADSAFCGCSSLTSLCIPDSVTSIGSHAFDSCTSLETITLPSSLSGAINEGTFSECHALKSVVIPGGVTSIDFEAFWECDSLESVSLPEGLKRIGSQAFFGCSALTDIDMPDTVTVLGSEAFKFCRNLQSVHISEGLKSIPKQAFSSCESLSELVIPQQVSSIESWAFEECTSLRAVSLPSTITTIGQNAFAGCAGILKLVVACMGVNLPNDLLGAVNPIDGIVFTDDAELTVRAQEAGLLVCSLGLAPFDISKCTIVYNDEKSDVASVSNQGRVLSRDVSYTVRITERTIEVTGCGAYGGCVSVDRPVVPQPEPADPQPQQGSEAAPHIPQTGDNTNRAIAGIFGVVLTCAVVLIGMRRRNLQ